MKFLDRLKHSWDAFITNKDPTVYEDLGMASYLKPDRFRLTRGNERSMVTAIYNRIALDASSFTMEHARIDENKRYIESIDSGLNNCLNLSANIDQTGRAFRQDAIMSMFDEGYIAIVPVDTSTDPRDSGSYDIDSMRVARITQWYPKHIKMECYNENTGKKEELTLPKDVVCIIENPFYAVMNEQNSTLQRLIRKLTLLDYVDEAAGSGKLDLIIQLPYTIKSEARKMQAEERKRSIESQLTGSKLGIAYIDSTEHITQLNRSVENNLLTQIQSLIDTLYSQLGITKEIMDGTADEKTMKNYYARTIEPILAAITDEMKRKFLTKTARTRGQSIVFFSDPFKLVPASDVAEMADKFTRNEIMSSNEFRQIIGLKPVADPRADELRNKNLNAADGQEFATTGEGEGEYPVEEVSDPGQTAEIDNDIEQLLNMIKEENGTISHAYSSPYYDPVKAHEYYEAHKKLKGKSSSTPKNKTLNEKGQIAKQVIQEKMTEEKQATTTKEIASLKDDISKRISNYSEGILKKKDEIYSKLDSLPEAERAEKMNYLKAELDKLTLDNKNKKDELTKGYANEAKEKRASITEDYKSKMEEEIKKLYSNSEFTKAKSSGKKLNPFKTSSYVKNAKSHNSATSSAARSAAAAAERRRVAAAKKAAKKSKSKS